MENNKQTALIKKSAIYIRVSTQYQIDKDSLQVQRRDLVAYTELVLGIKDYEVFEDPGYSAKNTDRPAFQRMMSRLRTGEFSHLLVWKIDRISRNLLDFTEMYNELKKLGVVFVSKNEQFDTSSAIGEAMLKIILVFAELERKMTSERVTAVMLSRANNGQWNGGRIPFGYDWDKEKKQFTINQKEAEIYRLICNLYDEEQSLIAVARKLNEKGFVTKTGGPWGPVGIRAILTNSFYTGMYRYNMHKDGNRKKVEEWIDVPDHHPALTTEEKINRYKFLLTRNRRSGFKEGDSYKRKNIHIFAGLIKCGNCGANLTATPDRRRADGWMPSMYGCSSIRKKLRTCDNKFISDVQLAPFVFWVLSVMLNLKSLPEEFRTTQVITSRFLVPEFMKDICRIDGLDTVIEALKVESNMPIYLTYVNPASKDSNQLQSDSLRTQAHKLETAMQRLHTLYLYGDEGLSEKDYIIERKRLQDDLDQINAQLATISEQDELISDSDFAEKASFFLMTDMLLNFDTKKASKLIRSIDSSVEKAFLNKVINRITITTGRVEEIDFKNSISLRFVYRDSK